MIITREYIANALITDLPGAKSHRKMLPPKRTLKVAPANKNSVKQSSVLLLLFIENNELTACLIKRPAHMKYHAGQIALPGGRVEKGETIIETALRETHEEIGILSKEIEILGSLTEFYVEVSQFQIHSIVGWLNKKPEIKINPDEVEKIILFPISKFRSPFDEIELETSTGKLKVPCIKFKGEIIWGATAMILSEFSDILEQNFPTSE